MGASSASEKVWVWQDATPFPYDTGALPPQRGISMITVIFSMLLGWFGCTLVMTIFASRATKPVA
jgi:hypothetical protein